MCGGVVACAIAWPLTFGVERYAAVRLSALSLGRARFVLSVVRRHGCPRHYLGRIRLRLGVVPRFGCPRHYLGRARLGLGVVRRYGCSRYRLPAHVLDCALFRDSVARADTWLHALSQTVYAHSTPARHSLTSCPACPLFLLNAPARHSGFPMRRHASPVANRLPAIPRRPATPHMPADAPAHSPARPAS